MTEFFSRRAFLRWSGAAAIGGGLWACSAGSAARSTGPGADTTPDTTPAGPQAAPAPKAVRRTGGTDDRRLVVIELDGGNDGLSTLVPYGLGAYRDLRTATAVEAADVLTVDDEVGWNARLARTAKRGIAGVQGVGSHTPDGSHFEMMRRWWSGDPDGSGRYATGFLGRLADAIGASDAPAVAVSVGSSSSAALISRTASTLALPSAGAAQFLRGADPDDTFAQAFQRSFASAAAAGGDGLLGRMRAVDLQALGFAATLLAASGDDQDGNGSDSYPDSDLGAGLRLAAALVAEDNGVRIVHVPMGGDFDTHENHLDRHGALLDDFDAAVEAFLADLERRRIADRVLVMTTSEFGRRARDNGSDGLDHGTASTALLLGPVKAGLYGAAPSLTALDEDDNLVATLGFDSYYGTIAERWFGVPAAELFDTAPPLIDRLLA